MASNRHPPNRNLAWERLQRGWSHDEVSRRIGMEMDHVGETYTGLCANTVRRWETGERRPEPRYRKHLVTVFGKPASELGLLTPDELKMRPDITMGRVDGMPSGATGDASWDRATVLRALLGAGALPLLSPLLSVASAEGDPQPGSSQVDPETYTKIANGQRELYWNSPPRPLFEASFAHTHLGVALVRGAHGTQRAALAAGLVQSALLAGRLAFFDLGQPAVATRCYEVALTASKEAGNHALAATVLGHMAFIPGFSQDPGSARNLLAAALQHCWHGVDPIVRSWLHCVSSEIEARSGASATSRHQIDLAEASLPDAPSDLAWFDFYDAARLDSFAGYAALTTGDHPEAARRLTAAADRLGAQGSKQRSVILADLAGAHGRDGDRIADYLGQAIDALTTDWYATGIDRVRAIRPLLGDSKHGRHLDGQIRALSPAL
ncbi:transcriptional regulator [Parafrankia soli]|uniref:Transcriptional regulator n=1 Tax=Parafrankia soli TaxID=2599596 RepID=A0A1S1RF11_9ACTN|nr:helix-turn-helix transcriptional regulator [Parafrankia soli]OHV45283.1 transcriptional regulator [Parafrankia soli]